MKRIWIFVCTLLGAVIGAALLSFFANSAFLTVAGSVVGAGTGWVFGKYVPFLSFLSDLLG